MDKHELLRIIAQAADEGWTSLDLSNQGLTELPPEIGKLTDLMRLSLKHNHLKALPCEIGELTSLMELELSNNQLSMFPVEFEKLRNLTKLYLINDQITKFPLVITKLTNLIGVDLRHNYLTTLPSEIEKLTGLRWIGLVENQLTTLPQEINKLTHLEELDLKGNPLPIPDKLLSSIYEPSKIINYYIEHKQDFSEIEKIVSIRRNYITLTEEADLLQVIEHTIKSDIKTLNLSFNKLRELPAEIKKLSNLNWLEIRHNQLNILPKEIGELTNLTGLDLGYNQLCIIPPEIGKMKNLMELSLTNNQITELPSEIGQLSNLKKIYLADNQLTTLPPEIAKLHQLEFAGFVDNKLTTLPHEIGKLSNLKSISLRSNLLTILPSEIGKLINLTEMYLAGNHLSSLPLEIGNLINLMRLTLEGNQLTELPHEIGQLINLEHLDIGYNRLTHLPKEIKKLTNIKSLNLKGNPLPIPPEILEMIYEPAKILNYYFQEGQKKPLHEAKVLFVGQGAVGKTSLIKRLLEDAFNPVEIKTDGIAIKHWHINQNGADIRLNVWDFGGQEIMHATHQFFLTKRSLYLLVLDSRLDEKENRVEYWLKMVQSFGGNSPVIVVCNKSDQHDLELDWRGLQMKYPAIKAFAKKVSCKTGDGIAELRELIGRETGQLEHIHDELILPWFAVKTQLEEMQRDYIAYGDYQKMCAAENVTDDLSQQTLLGFLHDLGIVLHFHDHPILEDTNVLNPEWVTRGVYQILNSNELFQRKGELERAALDRILDPQAYPRSKHQFILDMMRKFELCFDFAEQAGERFLVPDLLAKEEPYTGEWDDSLGFQYHYDILPGSVISRFMVRMHAYIHQRTYWRSGVVLISEDRANRAFIKADTEDRKIFISITGRQDTRYIFLAIIRADFRKIHATIPKLLVKEKVPIPGHPHIVVDYEHLRTLEELGEESFIPEGLRMKVNVKQLLHGISGKSAARQTGMLEQARRNDLQKQLELIDRKQARLEQEKILHTRTDEKFRIENLLEELTEERQAIERQLRDIGE